VSLRTELHSAFDELAPSTVGLRERVVQTVVHERTTERRRQRLVWVRAPLSLVAVLVLIALVVGTLVGGRLVSDWQSFTKRSVPSGIDTTQLSRLEARPFQMPLLKPDAACPGGPWDPATGWWGTGPAHVYSWTSSGFVPGTITPWGIYDSFHAEIDRSIKGPVLVRARDLKTGDLLVFVGQYAAGPVGGADKLDGQEVEQRLELALDASHPQGAASGGFYAWSFTAGLKADTSHHGGALTVGPAICTGWQIDGEGFTETFEVPF
jgi:hypothetical protein